MPTISQLPSVTQATPADQVPLSQSGVTHSVSVGALLAGTQPAILADTGTLLGRTSVGPGGPEPVTVGTGLALNNTTLAATGTDHADFVPQTNLVATDQVVVNSNGQPRLLSIAILRELFSPGQNISIDTAGTISTTGDGQSFSFANLPVASSPSSQDLIGISQGGTARAISYAALLDGQTIDMAQAAGPPQDSDQFWTAQGSSTMVRQDLGALWVWIASKLPGFHRPVVELSTSTTLDTTVHNGTILICSQPITLQGSGVNLGSGFVCDVINLSGGSVTLEGSIITSSGEPGIPPAQMATIRCVGYSGGTVIYATVSNVGSASSPPAQVSGLAAVSSTQDGVTLLWGPVTGASSYVVEYHTPGAADWSVACSGLAGTTYCVSGLLPSTTYEFGVLAANSAGSSAALATTTASTTAPLAIPGQVTGLTAGAITAASVDLTWSQPSTGGPVTSYTVQVRASGGGTWTTGGSGIGGMQYTVAGLVPNMAYDFQVLATNAAGSGPASTITTVSTAQAAGIVTAITWNLVPSGPYVHGIGTIGVNAHVTPGTATVQFGFSTSVSVIPTTWIAASYVNTDLWGAYVPTPAIAGTWFVWVSGTDGSCPTAYATGFTVS